MPPTAQTDKSSAAGGFRLGWPLAVLVIGLTLTAVGGWLVYNQSEQTDALRFRRLSERLTGTLSARLQNIEEALYGGRGLFAASASVERAEWTSYARNMEGYFRRGVLGFGYIERVRRPDLPAFLARMRADGAPDFEVHPTSDRDELYVVTYVEPRAQNTGALGKDLADGRKRRRAAEEAMRTDRATLTRRIILRRTRGGCRVFSCFCRSTGRAADPVTPADRERALQGWVFAAIRIDELMDGVARVAEDQVDFDVFDGESATMSSLIFDSDQHLDSRHGEVVTAADYAGRRFSTLVPLSIHGRHWSLWISSRPEFGATISRVMLATVLGSGVAISLLAAALTWLLITAHSRAVVLAERMTRDLRATEADLRRERQIMDAFMRSVPDVVYFKDLQSRFIRCSDSMVRKHGTGKLSELIGKTDFDFFPEEQARSFFEIEQQIIRTGQPIIGLPVKEVFPDGHVQWSLNTKMPLYDEDGRVIGTFGIGKDITDAQDAPREGAAAQEAFFRFIFEHAPVGISWYKPDDVALPHRQPRACAHHRGFRRGIEAAGGLCRASRIPRTIARQQVLVKKFISGEISEYFLEKRYLHPDGEIVWAAFTSRMFVDPATGRKQVVTTMVDITAAEEDAGGDGAEGGAATASSSSTRPWASPGCRAGAAETRIVNPAHERITGVPAALAKDTSNYTAVSIRTTARNSRC